MGNKELGFFRVCCLNLNNLLLIQLEASYSVLVVFLYCHLRAKQSVISTLPVAELDSVEVSSCALQPRATV